MTDFKAIFLDVGQGDCTLIALPDGKHMLVDIYRCPGKGTVDVFKVLRDVLTTTGDSGKPLLDYLVITHAHDDHIWGIGDLAEEFEIGELWVPQYGTKKELSDNFEAFKKVVDDQPEDRRIWQKGSRSPVADLGEVSVRCFSPPGYIEVEEELDEDEARKQVHENCGVFRLSYEGVSVMLTGDSDLVAWERIIDYYKDRPDANDLSVLGSAVLHASHHGSRTFVKEKESDTAWLDALNAIEPDEIIISVGESNRHGHPHSDMLSVYEDAVGSDSVRETKDDGTLVMTITGEDDYTVEADASYADNFGWDDDDDDGTDAKSAGPSGDGGLSRVRRPPAVPPPGYEKTPQRAPRRERYAAH